MCQSNIGNLQSQLAKYDKAIYHLALSLQNIELKKFLSQTLSDEFDDDMSYEEAEMYEDAFTLRMVVDHNSTKWRGGRYCTKIKPKTAEKQSSESLGAAARTEEPARNQETGELARENQQKQEISASAGKQEGQPSAADASWR